MRAAARSPGRLAGALLSMLGAAWCALAPASARDVTASERAALTRMLDGFVRAMDADDGAGVVATMPPRMVAWIAAQSHIDEQVERRSIEDQIDALKPAGVRQMVTFGLDHADFESLKDGTPYAVIPMHSVVDGPRHMEIDVKALALMEDGTWYLLSLGTPARLERLRKAFPEFDGIAFEDATPVVKP